jgi:outer membrane receptor for ferrienterochelin and colicins
MAPAPYTSEALSGITPDARVLKGIRTEASASRTWAKIVGLLAEKQFGRVRLFVNGENLTGVRQTRWDPLLLQTRAVDGRWTVDAWAPLEGRNINGGLRVRF